MPSTAMHVMVLTENKEKGGGGAVERNIRKQSI